jgi:hypothetical protein
VAGAERYLGVVEEHAGRAGEVADDMVFAGGVRVVQAEGAAVLNRPGFCGGSQSTGEWDDGSSTEVSGRAA